MLCFCLIDVKMELISCLAGEIKSVLVVQQLAADFKIIYIITLVSA